ncbi:MAG TPA: acyl carrier protein [Polyangiaceae bacterium]|nr:acyl carrier protein [Polyangiaceae bacterium]
MDSKKTLIFKKIAQLTRKPVDDIRADRTLRELVQDSFALVEMVVELEDEFGVHISQEDFVHVSTVGDLTTLIGDRMKAEAG